MKNKQKSFAGDDVSTVYLNDWLNPQGKGFVDLAVRIRGVRATKSLNVYIPFRVSEAELTGRINTTNAAAVEEDIQSIRSEHPGLPIVLDADRLSYISSAGLRVILRLRKQEPRLALINAAPEVYQVFEMTGSTEMMTIEKACPRRSLPTFERYAAVMTLLSATPKQNTVHLWSDCRGRSSAFLLHLSTISIQWT